ncbi:hypothetical protein DSO57_1007735 [Entomophthora muscae]|nr:hypothetical protein DSO57_1007735 [Entomophthora muscae]
MIHMRYPLPLSDHYIQRFGLNHSQVREQEKVDRDHVEFLNAIGYISDLALGFNALLTETAGNIISGVDDFMTGGGTHADFSQDIISVMTGQRPLVAPSDMNILHNFLQ